MIKGTGELEWLRDNDVPSSVHTCELYDIVMMYTKMSLANELIYRIVLML